MILQSNGLTWDRGAAVKAMSSVGKLLLFFGWVAFAVALGHDGLQALVSTSLLAGLGALTLSYVVWLTRTSPRPGALELRGETLIVHSGAATRVIAKKDVATALIVKRTVGDTVYPTVELQTRGGSTLCARTSDDTAARAFVEALGFGAGGKRVRVALERPSRRLIHPVIGVFAYGIGAIVGMFAAAFFVALTTNRFDSPTVMFVPMAVAIAAAYAALKRVLAAPVVEIGNDGIIVRRGLRSRRFSRRELADVVHRTAEAPLLIERKDGTAVSVDAVMVDADRKAAVAALAGERLVRPLPAPDRAASFERGGRDAAAWRAQIRSSLDAGYREAGASIDDAAAVLASPGATSEQRIGAAIALRIAGEPPERVRVAAEGAVDPRVRVVLDAIADDAGDEKIDRALRRLA